MNHPQLLVATVLLVACGTPSEKPLPADVLAEYRGGVVSAADLDNAVLSLTKPEQLAFTRENLEPFRDLVSNLVLERVLRAEALNLGLDHAPDLIEQKEGLRRQALARAYVDKHLPPLNEPTEDEIREAFEDLAETLTQPETRSVFHLFRRRAAGTDVADLVAELEEIRQRVLEGESFALIAAASSDSESRHQEGYIGDIVRGKLPAQLEQVIFALEEKVPSAPLVTGDGVHLFYIEAIAPARIPEFSEARSLARSHLLASRRSAEVQALLDTLDVPADSFIPDQVGLDALMRNADPETLVLRIGDFQIQLRAFNALVAHERSQLSTSNKQASLQVPWHVFEALVYREKAYSAAAEAGDTLSEAATKEIATTTNAVMIERYRGQLMNAALRGDFARELETFFQENRNRFTSPLQLQLRRLTLPLDGQAEENMAMLEALAASPANERETLEQVQARIGGELQLTGWQSIERLVAAEPKMARFASRLQPGELSPPYRTVRGTLDVFEMLARREPEPLEFDQARPAVTEAFLRVRGPEVYQHVVAAQLAAAEFRLDEERLATAVEDLSLPPAKAPVSDGHSSGL
ncbi:MAG: peptidyl-prolyl cis-trans isomerase [Thermoanaerobaculia bacterium]|nr:peptidyl-prolyl cis-trans isomerase [Thermoanaerobaculia bacterium]